MGEVFAARDETTQRKVALKRLLSAHLPREALFRAEYHALARLKHPYIIQAFEYGSDHGLPFYTMELLDGQDLLEAGPSDYRECCRMLRDVATSLALLHAQRLLHRDISPRNVRKTLSGRCKLIDFGMMVPFGVPPNLAGTPPFVSPEAWDGSVLDQRSDLYSLGALAYWLITRKLPYEPKTIAQHGYFGISAPARLQRTVADIPDSLNELVMSLLELDPVKRPTSAAEVIGRLNQIAELEPDDSVELAQSYLSSARFVGRRHELQLLEQALSMASEGQGTSVYLTGPAGIGRTRLLQEFALLAQTRGTRVVRIFGAGSGSSGELVREIYQSLRRTAPEAIKRLTPQTRSYVDQLERETRNSGRLNTPTMEFRAAIHTALAAYVEAAAEEGTWVLLIDDLHLSDASSSAFVASLARQAKNRPMLVVATGSGGVDASGTAGEQNTEGLPAQTPAEVFASESQRLLLTDLEHDETRALCASLFGNVPHLDRLVDWLYRQAHGNPGLTMELASLLLRKNIIRYIEGSFILPPEEITEPVPEGLTHTLTLKLEQMSEGAKRTAELVAIFRGSAALDVVLLAGSEACVDGLAGIGPNTEDTLAALEELVQHGVLVSQREAYRFAQEAMGSAIRQKLSPERERELHARLADALLSQATSSSRAEPRASTQAIERQLEAGWHLVHTDRAMLGADLLARVTPPLIESGMAYTGAVAAAEKALSVYEQHGTSLEKRLVLRTALVRAGFLYDYKLANRYGNETVEMLEAWMALPTLRKLEKYFGSLFVVFAIFAFVSFKRVFLRGKRRGPSAYLSIKSLARAVVSLVGVRVLGLDGEGASALIQKIGFFQNMPQSTSARPIYLLCSTIALQPFGREVEVRQRAEEALEFMRSHGTFGLVETERLDMRAGLLLSAGINECYRAGSQALAMADNLDSLGTQLARAGAQRIRFTHHMVRGARDEAERYRRMLDVHAIQGGTTWQVDWFAVPVEGLNAARAGDMVSARRALERLEELAQEVPSLSTLRDAMRVMYHSRRGNPGKAIELGEQFVARVPMRSSLGWVSGYGAYAAALNDAGRHAEARDLCERAQHVITERDREYAPIYAYLDRELAIAYAGLGMREKAEALLQRNIDLYEGLNEHALAYNEHEAAARVAGMHGDGQALRRSVQAMRDAALRVNSAHFLTYSARAAATLLRSLPREEHAPLRVPRGVEFITPLDGVEKIAAHTPVRGFTRSRARHGLKLAMEKACAQSAHLYIIGAEQAILAVSSSDEDPPNQVLRGAWSLGVSEGEGSSNTRRARIHTIRVHDRTYELIRLPKQHDQTRISVLALEYHGEPSSRDVPDSMLEKLTGWSSAE